MRSRVLVDNTTTLHAIGAVCESLQQRLDKHGPYSYIGPHECYGVCAEEMDELLDAVRANNREQAIAELKDIAVAAIFSIASLEALEGNKNEVQETREQTISNR